MNLKNIRRFIRKILAKTLYRENTINIMDVDLITSFLSNPDFPWLISFSRTGSHWLRMIMELYFEKPSLVEIFVHKDAKDFTCFHRHDNNLSFVGCRNVIYLYRDPVDTIYSQIKFDKDDTDNLNLIIFWAESYGKHLSKWLVDEKFTVKKTTITYEDMKNDMHGTFKKICEHFDEHFDGEKLDNLLKLASKNKLKKITTHTPQVINLSNRYENDREVFRQNYSSMIYDLVFEQNALLKELIPVK